MQCIAVVLLASDNTLHNTLHKCMHEVPCMSAWMFGWVLISLWLVGFGPHTLKIIPMPLICTIYMISPGNSGSGFDLKSKNILNKELCC